MKPYTKNLSHLLLSMLTLILIVGGCQIFSPTAQPSPTTEMPVTPAPTTESPETPQPTFETPETPVIQPRAKLGSVPQCP